MRICTHCGSEPVRRYHEASARHMVQCPTCNNRGDATTSEVYALASWERVNAEDMPPCLGCAGKARYFQRAALWHTVCTGCGYEPNGGARTLEGAVASWYRDNRRGDQLNRALWGVRMAQLNEQRRRPHAA